MKFIHYLVDTTELGYYQICLIFSKGFFFYFYLLASILYKIFPIKLFNKLKNYFKERQEDTTAFLLLVLLFLFGVCIYTYFYEDHNIKYVDEKVLSGEKSNIKNNNHDTNLYKRYGSYDINSINFNKLNENVVLWLMVDGTNINYPVVKGKDNSFYLDHDINGNLKTSGWVFMDYRNDSKLSDDNTIIYGHNLANKTAFGSLDNLFTDKWFKESNHLIVVRNRKKKYVYKVFSVYESSPETYYLQNNVYEEYLEFLNTLKSRSKFNFDVELDKNSKIITLSTCTSDNKNRKVVHAVKIK